MFSVKDSECISAKLAYLLLVLSESKDILRSQNPILQTSGLFPRLNGVQNPHSKASVPKPHSSLMCLQTNSLLDWPFSWGWHWNEATLTPVELRMIWYSLIHGLEKGFSSEIQETLLLTLVSKRLWTVTNLPQSYKFGSVSPISKEGKM